MSRKTIRSPELREARKAAKKRGRLAIRNYQIRAAVERNIAKRVVKEQEIFDLENAKTKETNDNEN
jgi:RNase P protein component